MKRRLGSQPFWLIEHASYGVLMEWVYTSPPQPRFSWMANRSEGITFDSQEDALEAWRLCRDSGRAGMRGCYILKWDGKNFVSIGGS